MSSDTVDPILNPEAWDAVFIGQVKSPGIVKVTGFKRGNEWDIKKGKGTVGATLTYVSKPPAKGTFTFSLWRSSDFFDWREFRQLLKYDPTKKSVTAVDVYYPSLADLDIKSIVVENIGAIEHQGQQLYTIAVDVIEYLPVPKKSAVSTPAGSKSTQSGTTPGAPPDPISDAHQAEIARLLKQASAP